MKPKTFCQLYVHIVFAVKNRKAMLNHEIQPKVFAYMSRIITNMEHKSIIINGTENHVHLLVGINPAKSISELVQKVKRDTSLFINKEKLCKGKFSWQEGYGAFSSTHKNLEKVFNYIFNQHNHHKKRSFREEYLSFLEQLEIPFDDRFLFDFLESG